MTQGTAAFGTYLKIGDGNTPENFTTVAEVTNIGGPNMKVKMVDMTNHSSAGAFTEQVPTTIDVGALKLTVNWIPTHPTQGYATGLLRDLVNRNPRNFKLVFPDTAHTTWLLPCYVVSFDSKAAVEGKSEADFELDITGQPTLA